MEKADTAIRAFQHMKESLISKGYVNTDATHNKSFYSAIEIYKTVGLDNRPVVVTLFLSDPYSFIRQRGLIDTSDGYVRRFSIEVRASVKGVNDASEVERLVGYFDRYGKPIVKGRNAKELQEKLFS